MFEIPSRDSLDTLTEEARAIAPVTAVGFACSLPDACASVVYSYSFGVGEFRLPVAGLPDALVPSPSGFLQADGDTLESQRSRAAEAFLLDNQTRRLVSVPLPTLEPPGRLWVGLASTEPLTPDQLGRLDALASDGERLLTQGV